MKWLTMAVRVAAFAVGTSLLGFVIGTVIPPLDTGITVLLFAIALLCIGIAFVRLPRRGGCL